MLLLTVLSNVVISALASRDIWIKTEGLRIQLKERRVATKKGYAARGQKESGRIAVLGQKERRRV